MEIVIIKLFYIEHNDRTLVPIRAIIEAMGGTVSWETETRTAILNYGKDKIGLVINSTTAYLNGEPRVIDTAPTIINDRTMLPIRFIAESFGFNVKWDGDTQTITITKEATEKPDAVSSATPVKDSLSPSSDAAPVPSADTKMLVVYFSRAGENYSVGMVDKGNTSYIADYIAEQTGADVFEIIPKNPYPEGYEDTKTRATNERNSNARPEYIGEVENFEQYDVVFIGHPIWWGDMPMIMYTFLENHDFNGKIVCQFNTHEGSGNSGTSETIKRLLPDATVTDYLAVHGSTAQRNGTELKDAVDRWLEALGHLASKGDKKMTVTINNTDYEVEQDSNVTADEIVGNLPLNLTMTRYAGHEYYAELPFTPTFVSEQTSTVLAGHIYYWDGWNAFVLNFEDTNIAPYKVVHIGEIKSDGIKDILSKSGDKIEIKEITYQAVAYLGIGRVFPFLKAVNKFLVENGIKLPLENQANTTMENRLEKGIQAQVDIFGEGMKDFYKSGPVESRHINRWLADNCFGDYYTRGGLDYAERELITFCFLAAQGGCEPQLTSHAAANIKNGNDKLFLIKIISHCLPFIGYPRSLNALSCVNKAAESMRGE